MPDETLYDVNRRELEENFYECDDEAAEPQCWYNGPVNVFLYKTGEYVIDTDFLVNLATWEGRNK